MQQLKLIPAAMHVIITGTPIQNNLMELHALVDFVCKVSGTTATRLLGHAVHVAPQIRLICHGGILSMSTYGAAAHAGSAAGRTVIQTQVCEANRDGQ